MSALGPRPLEIFPFVTELATGGSAIELPVDRDSVTVDATVPSAALAAQRL